jgi:hypothetical protein
MSRRTRNDDAPQGPVMKRDRSALGPPWAPLTRRAFVTMIGAAAAALAVRSRGAVDPGPADDDRPPSPWAGTTRWIGHC